MKYFISKSDKLNTKTTTFNITEEALVKVKETINGMKKLGINITQGEVISDMIMAYGSSEEKIYQVDGKKYSVEDLCEKALEQTWNSDKIKTLVNKFYVELRMIERSVCEEVKKKSENEIEQEIMYKNVMENSEKEITDKVVMITGRLVSELSQEIYKQPFGYVEKASTRCKERILAIVEYFLPTQSIVTMMKGLELFRKFEENKNLTLIQVEYIYKTILKEETKRYEPKEASDRIFKLRDEGRIELDVRCFINMVIDTEKPLFRFEED